MWLIAFESLLKNVYVMARYSGCQPLSNGMRGRCGFLSLSDHAGVGQVLLDLVQ